MGFETKLTPVKIGLPEMLNALWDELQQASQEAISRNEGRFLFEEAEIEIAVAVEAETSSKFSLHVVEFGGGLKGSRTATVRVKVKQYTEKLAKNTDGRLVFFVDKSTVPGGAADVRPRSREEARRLKGAKD